MYIAHMYIHCIQCKYNQTYIHAKINLPILENTKPPPGRQFEKLYIFGPVSIAVSKLWITVDINILMTRESEFAK